MDLLGIGKQVLKNLGAPTAQLADSWPVISEDLKKVAALEKLLDKPSLTAEEQEKVSDILQ